VKVDKEIELLFREGSLKSIPVGRNTERKTAVSINISVDLACNKKLAMDRKSQRCSARDRRNEVTKV